MEINYKDLVDNIHDGLYIVDTQRKIVYWNKAAEEITGFSSEEVVGSHCHDNILMHVDKNGCQLCKGSCPLSETIADSQTRKTKVYLHHKNGHRVPVWARTLALRDSNGNITGGAEVFTDIRNKQAYNHHINELEKLAFLDHLTGVANRRYIEIELNSRMAELQRYQLSFGVLFIDLDKFKRLNDTYGHQFGDKVLKTVAQTLQGNLRPFDLIGRWGGEEFICIVRNVDKDELAYLGDRLRLLVETSHIYHNGKNEQVTISIGATLAVESDTVKSLLKRVDDLLYKSKHQGRNRITYD